jgi:hypothetical protein
MAAGYRRVEELFTTERDTKNTEKARRKYEKLFSPPRRRGKRGEKPEKSGEGFS